MNELFNLLFFNDNLLNKRYVFSKVFKIKKILILKISGCAGTSDCAAAFMLCAT